MHFKKLIDKVEKINNDIKYEELNKFWNRFYSLKENRIPINITFTMAFFAKNLGINLIEHYKNSKKYVEDSLKIIIFQDKEINDDKVKGPIVINFGEAFEASLFGVNPIFKHDIDPWLGQPIIKNEEDLNDLKYPDFYNSGLMPMVHSIYETAEKIVAGRIPVIFERWDRSPWGLAVHLRGLGGLFIDSIHHPDLVHKLLKFLTESRMRWEREKERFLGIRIEKSRLSNDEVDGKIISPIIYENFAYPYEKELANFYPKGISYFHSCGNITPFLDYIIRIRGLKRLHISPVTDFKIAIDKIGKKMVFQKRMDPNIIAFGDESSMKISIKETLKIGQNIFMEIDPGPVMDVPIENIKRWVKITKKEISNTRVPVVR
ncbi:MAG: uroporphyrinogen decarboxylase family protein [Candidatus Hodarchaeota archaeon]